MTNRTRAGIVLLMVSQALAACDGGPNPPGAPGDTTPPGGDPPVDHRMSVRGLVFDTAFRRLSGARVEVLDGPQAGTSTLTNAMGEFILPGPFDEAIRFRATNEGHAAVTRTHQHGSVIFHLDVPDPPLNIAGDYTLTFVADAACAGLPDELKTRTYFGALTASSYEGTSANTAFDLTLDGARVLNPGYPRVGVAGDFAGFALFDDGVPYILEQVAPGRFVAITGWAGVSAGTLGGSPISTAFEGWIEYLDAPPPQRPLVSCKSNNHRLILARR